MMILRIYLTILFSLSILYAKGQDYIPFDTVHWDVQAQGHVVEEYMGKDAIYINLGMAVLKNTEFINGTIEFDIYLTNRRSFPGIRFRAFDDTNAESFYFRNELSGKPDANQVTPVFNGLSAWQLYFGPQYSFKYNYTFDQWTHVRLVVNGDKAQLYLDYSEKPNHSWILKNKEQAGKIMIGGSQAPMHYANFRLDTTATEIIDFELNDPEKIEGVFSSWSVSDAFNEKVLDDYNNIGNVIRERVWNNMIEVEENNACNISRIADRPTPDLNTVMVKVDIESEKDQIKFFEFGYSDRVVAVLNNQSIYRGNNSYRTRDYRYLGTIGFFDGIYLNLKAGSNTLILAVSESFGGWGVTGKIKDMDAISITH